MANFNLTKMAVNMYCPGNVVQLDDAGLPSVMVYIPSFKLSDVLNTADDSTHPAFIVNGKEIPGFYYSKYQNVVHNGKAYSLPAENPRGNIDFENAREHCEAKGYGWHLSTAAEWAAIALWCKKNSFLPYGNNAYGKDNRENAYKAIPAVHDNGKIAMVASGTGPMKWSHDQTASGIWDMNGNMWEWQGGLRVVWGELQIFANNDAASPEKPQNRTSTFWKAINAADGSLVEPECLISDTDVKASGNTVKLDYVTESGWAYKTGISNASDTSRYSQFASIVCGAEISDAAKVLLRAFALLPEEGGDEYDMDTVYWNNKSAECCIYRGGSYYDGYASGVFSISGSYPRTRATGPVGFRAAYIPNI